MLVSEEEHLKWIQDFWDTRTQGDPQAWATIRRACEETPDMAATIIESADLKLKDGWLTQVTDATGNWFYRVPISCINAPLRYVPQDEVTDKTYEEKDCKDIKMRNNREDKDEVMTFSNLIKVEELKSKYLAKVGKEGHTVRLMYGGREMKDQ